MSARELIDRTRRFVDDEVLPNVAGWDHDDELPDSAWRRMHEIGLPAALVPARYGGLGLGVGDLIPSWRILSQGWISLTGAINPTGLAATLLARHGTDEQRERWLPALAGGALAAFSITEPQAGSDLGRLTATARPLESGGFVLDGSKRWIAGGGSAEVIFVMLRAGEAEKPSCVVLPADGRGSASWRVEELDKVGYRGVESMAFEFSGHEAPGAELLGGEAGLGRGPAQMLDALDVGRVNVACRALGVTDRAIEAALGEGREREIGLGVLGDHTHARIRIGEMLVKRAAVHALTVRAGRAIDAGEEGASDFAIAAKLLASETAVWAVDQASRLAASRSYASENELARLRRDAPQTQIGEGANDALLLALGGAHLKGLTSEALQAGP